MRKSSASQSGAFNPRVLLAVALCSVGALLAMLSFAATPSSEGPYLRPGRPELVSVASDGTQGNATSFTPFVSVDGRYVAFWSNASNLVPGDTNGISDAFVHDRETGTTARVSVKSDGTQAAAGASGTGSSYPSMSADGRYVVFFSASPNLVPGDTNGIWDVFVHDRGTGTTERVSVASNGTQGNSTSIISSSQVPSMSADGRYVVFYGSASNLVPGDTGNYDVFLRDRESETTELVSVGVYGAKANGNSFAPSVSADGRYVTFCSDASNLVPDDTNASRDIFVHDRETGTTERVSVASDGTEGDGGPNSGAQSPAISDDGRYVAFYTWSSKLVPWDTNGTADIFVHDRETRTTERVSVASDGTEGNNSSGNSSISADGRFVAFYSNASNLVPNDNNQVGNAGQDVFVHDRKTKVTQRVSVASDGTEGNNGSWYSSISADGRYAAFQSFASNLVPNDNNTYGDGDAFVHDRGLPLGVSNLSTVPQGDQISLSGRATFSGAVMTSATDAVDDGTNGAEEAGGELTGVSLIYRPELGDVLVILRLALLPGLRCTDVVCEQGGGTQGLLPGYGRVVYGIGFQFGGTHYELHAFSGSAATVIATGNTEKMDPKFALYRCDPDCTEQSALTGGIGTNGVEVMVSVTLSAIGAQEGAVLTGIQAFSEAGWIPLPAGWRSTLPHLRHKSIDNAAELVEIALTNEAAEPLCVEVGDPEVVEQ